MPLSSFNVVLSLVIPEILAPSQGLFRLKSAHYYY